MRRIKGRLISVIMTLALIMTVFSSFNLKADAAGSVEISVSPVISNSMYQQVFNVYLSADGEYDVWYNGSQTQAAIPLSAGSHTLTFNVTNPSDVIGLDVWVMDDNGEWQCGSGDSINAYYVTINGVADDGTVLFEDSGNYLGQYEGELVYEAPASYDLGDTVYYCSNNIHVLSFGEDGYTFNYTTSPKGSRTIKIQYVDGQDQVIGNYEEVLNYGDIVNYTAPASYEAQGKTYTLRTAPDVTLDYNTASDIYTFEYDENIPEPEAPYEIEVNFVDADNNNAVLYTTRMTLDVGGSVRMELPNIYYSGLKQYQLTEGTSNVIEREFSSTLPITYNIPYRMAAESAPYDVTVYFTGDDGTALGSQTVTLTADGEPWIYDLASNPVIKSGDKEYHLISGQGNENNQIVCAYNDDPATRQISYQVIYTPEIIEEALPYPVTLRYINVSNNAVINTEVQDVAVGSAVTFEEAPETITYEGTELVRMNGQDGAIVHSYDQTQANYAVYYVDPTVPAPEVEVVEQVITQYVTEEGGTVVTDDTGTAAPQTVPVTTVTAPDGTVQAIYNAEGQQVTIENGVITPIEDENVPLADGDELSEDESTVTIEDEDTPKADMNSQKGNISKMVPWILAGVVIVIIALYMVLKNKKTEE